MSKHDSKKIYAATLHENLHSEKTGTIGQMGRLQSWSDSAGKAVEMYLAEPWVVVKAPYLKDPKFKVTFLVPYTGFKQIILADETNS